MSERHVIYLKFAACAMCLFEQESPKEVANFSMLFLQSLDTLDLKQIFVQNIFMLLELYLCFVQHCYSSVIKKQVKPDTTSKS